MLVVAGPQRLQRWREGVDERGATPYAGEEVRALDQVGYLISAGSRRRRAGSRRTRCRWTGGGCREPGIPLDSACRGVDTRREPGDDRVAGLSGLGRTTPPDQQPAPLGGGL